MLFQQHQVTNHGAPHLRGQHQADIGSVLDEAKQRGIDNILALRGDPPPGTAFTKPEGGFEYSYELVSTFIPGMNLVSAWLVRGHIACTEGREVDWDRLKPR